MTESGKTEADQLDMKKPISFGERLFAARESLGLTIADIAKDIHLSTGVIDALERSDVDRLPQPTFVQGYLRAYAKHLGLSEASILEEYSRAVPHTLEAELHPRSRHLDEANSGSLIVKSVSIVLVILIIVAVVYGVYNYYSEIFDSKKTGSENNVAETSHLLLPEYGPQTEKPYIEPGDNSKDVVEPQDDDQNITGVAQSRSVARAEIQIETQTDNEEYPEAVVTGVTNNTNREVRLETPPVAAGDDVIELMANEDSWTEVVDANDVGLLYDLVQQEHTVILRGTAPFDIFLGNAPAMEISVNGIKINMTKFVRSNNIAHFSVSTNDRQVVFH